MRLYIAEKPSLAKALADAIPGKHQRGPHAIRLANGDQVSWCVGHLLELAEPHNYKPEWKTWSFNHLPMLPDAWRLTPRAQTRKQLTELCKLIREAQELVHVGDPDREGQLLVDEVIGYAKISATRQRQVKRCLIHDLTIPAVKAALASLRDNAEFYPLSSSALARSHADWLYGMNLTRAYTLAGRKGGFSGLLSVGRVQTPVLGLIVERDKAIDAFITHPFYEVIAQLTTTQGQAFEAKWIPSEQCAPYLDEEGRNLSRPLAENVASRITDQPACVENYQQKQQRLAPPLPHCLSSLQIEANKRFGLSAQAVLDSCQRLYERDKLITYPRSDNRYLPQAHRSQAGTVLSAIGQNLAAMDATHTLITTEQCLNADRTLRSKTWDDAKVGAHHAIIPTQVGNKSLSGIDAQIYGLIARHYLAQFYPHATVDSRQALIRIGPGHFKASSKQAVHKGWQALFEHNPEDAEQTQAIPRLTKGETLHSGRPRIDEKQTSPPKPFTEATLLSAMTGINRFVKDKTLAKVLKDTDGLGTEATRAGIIELLIDRGFIARQAKNLRSTPLGKALIALLPDTVTTPDTTAQWEALLEQISQAAADYDTLMSTVQARLGYLIADCQNLGADGLNQLAKVTPNKPNNFRRKKSGVRKKPTTKAKPRKISQSARI